MDYTEFKEELDHDVLSKDCIKSRITEIDERIENLEYAIDYGYEDDEGQIIELILEKELLTKQLTLWDLQI